MKNPGSVFGTPEALSESSELTIEQKHAVLLQWKDQLQQLLAADDEGMHKSQPAAASTADLLSRVSSIFSRVDADLKQAPTPGDIFVRATYSWWLFLAIVVPGITAPVPVPPLEPAGAGCLDAGAEAYYPPLDSPPVARLMRPNHDAVAPVGAACFDKTTLAATWVTVASVVRTADSLNAVIGRFGAISKLLTVQYWSVTDHKWRPLVSSAFAILGAGSTQARADYSPSELATGEDQYYLVTDTRSGRAITYRLRLLQGQRGRVLVETSNVDPVKQWGFTLYATDGLDTLYFVDERSPGVWAYYSITRVLPAGFLAFGHDKSYINRAVALYRHYMHLPTDAEPPSAP
jgi:hypothetical protein